MDDFLCNFVHLKFVKAINCLMEFWELCIYPQKLPDGRTRRERGVQSTIKYNYCHLLCTAVFISTFQATKEVSSVHKINEALSGLTRSPQEIFLAIIPTFSS